MEKAEDEILFGKSEHEKKRKERKKRKDKPRRRRRRERLNSFKQIWSS